MLSVAMLRQRLLAASVSRRGIFYWGHQTEEDKIAATKSIIEKEPFIWRDVQIGKEMTYVPARIQEESKAMSSGFMRCDHVRIIDYYEWVRQPWFSRLFDPYDHFFKQRIRIYEKLIKSQKFVNERLIVLGPDLAAAHFLIHRNCRVMFKGREEWSEQDEKGRFPDHVPKTYEPGWYVERIDASDSLLIYEGFNNLRNLLFLKYLDISYSPLVDAWCLDRITGEYQDSLELLNLSGCENVTWNGLECLWRLRKLKTLILKDMDHIVDIKLLCLMLLDVMPDLEIIGVDYIDPKLLGNTSYEELLHIPPRSPTLQIESS